MPTNEKHITIEEVSDPVELDAARAQRESFDRNVEWLRTCATDVYSQHRGKCICIAGEEIFVADTAEKAVALAAAAHPEDLGRFVHYIPNERVARIYAH